VMFSTFLPNFQYDLYQVPGAAFDTAKQLDLRSVSYQEYRVYR